MISLDANDKDAFCWNLTNRCNMNCRFCFRELKEDELPLEENLKILDHIATYGLNGVKINKITFAGGEPLVYYGTKELLKAAHDRGIVTSIVTNGYILNEYNMDDYLPYLDIITFSCDSTNGHYNQQIGREEVNYGFDDSVVESSEHVLGLIPKIREKYGEDRLKIIINTMVLKDVNKAYKNLDEVSNAINGYLINYKIAKWKLLRFYPLRGSAIKNSEDFKVPDADFREIQEYYTSQSSEALPITVIDHKDLDDYAIISPQGYLKKSDNGTEYIVADLRDQEESLGEVRHV